MIRGVGRGFISGWAGVIMIGFALSAVTLCCCCWCYGLFYKRRRRDSLDDPVSDLTLQHDSPRFLKLLASKENERRLSQVLPIQRPGTPPMQVPIKNIVEYSGSVSPFPYMGSSSSSYYQDKNIIVPYQMPIDSQAIRTVLPCN